MTGQPADVFNTDETTPFPSTFISGTDTADSANNVVDVDTGEYYFPYVPAGQYRLRVDNTPDGMVFPSTASGDDILLLGLNNIVVQNGSRGQVFTLGTPSSVGIDLPIDVYGDVTLTKTAKKKVVGAGEVIPYSLTVTNNDTRTLKGLEIRDNFPSELRYVPGSLRLDGNRRSDTVSFNQSNMEMTIHLDDLAPGESYQIDYTLRVVPGIKDERILRNTAQAFGEGGFYSNVATADVRFRDDMMQSHATIVGRVYIDECNADPEAEKDIVGIPNIRLFKQNGEQVITDKFGRYSFSGVEPGMNVIQLDKITLPEDTELQFCENNTRHAGTAFSQFVDAKGGFLYKANFVVKGDKEKFRPKERASKKILKQQQAQAVTAETFVDQIEDEMLKTYDEAWLDTQKDNFELVYPGHSYHPGIKSLNFGVKYPTGFRVEAQMNGIKVSGLNKHSVISNQKDTVRLAHFRGVDMPRDRNELEITLMDNKNRPISRIKHEIFFNQEIYKIVLDKEASTLSADGLAIPEIIFKLKDKRGGAIASGKDVKVTISAPYSLYDAGQVMQLNELNYNNQTGGSDHITVEQNGRLHVRLNPTSQSGNARIRIHFNKKHYEDYDVWLQSAKREWILVGLAQGTVAYNEISGNMEKIGDDNDINESFMTDGKISFYTKGMISKDWLMTLSYDSSKKRDVERMRVFNEIAPDQKFAVVGDLSKQSTDAPSSHPLYLKLERDHFYALFGDFETGLTDSQLMPYSRRLSGFQTVYSGEQYQIKAFASEEGQNFVRDDIRIDGTTGPYKLNGINLIQGSERAYIEKRELNDPGKVTETTPLARYTDYDIDYQEGLIEIRNPQRLSMLYDSDLTFLRVEFETYQSAQKKMTYGARVAGNFIGGDIKVGVSAIHDGGAVGRAGSSDGYVVDTEVKLTKNTNLTAEYAFTNGEAGDNVSALSNNTGAENAKGMARRVEIDHRGDNLHIRAFYTERNNNFGLGTASGIDVGSKRYGAELTYDFRLSKDTSIKESEGSALRNGLTLFAKYNKQVDTNGRGNLEISEIGFQKESNKFKLYSGLRDVKENTSFSYDLGNGEQVYGSSTDITQWMSGAEIDLIQNHLLLYGSTEVPITTSNNDGFYGNKTRIGAEISPMRNVSVNAGHEWVDAQGREFENTRVAVNFNPFTGTSFSTVGTNHALPDDDMYSLHHQLLQQIPLSERWSLNLGLQHYDAFGGKDGIYSKLYDIPDYSLPFFLRQNSIRSPFSVSSRGYWEDYSVAGAGLLHANDGWSFNAVAEYRSAETENRLNLSSSWIGEVNKDLTVGVNGSYQWSGFKNGMTESQYQQDLQSRINTFSRNAETDAISIERMSLLRNSQIAAVTGGAAYRPNSEDGPIILHKLHLELRDNGADDRFMKAVNNLALQSDLTDKLELNAQYAFKYVLDDYDDTKSDDWVQVGGAELRYDVTDKWDIGSSFLLRHSEATNSLGYSTGLSAGYSPAQNMYLQFGYNIKGFEDRDFTLRSYTAQGPFMRMNMKFDQESVKSYLEDYMY